MDDCLSRVRAAFHSRLGLLTRPSGLFREERKGRREAIAAAPVARQTGEVPNVRLPIPIAAFRAQGRFSQLSAMSRRKGKGRN
jgi:hypothetical protein